MYICIYNYERLIVHNNKWACLLPNCMYHVVCSSIMKAFKEPPI